LVFNRGAFFIVDDPLPASFNPIHVLDLDHFIPHQFDVARFVWLASVINRMRLVALEESGQRTISLGGIRIALFSS